MKKYIHTLILLVFSLYSGQAQLNPDRHTTSPSDGWLSCNPTMNPNADLGMTHWVLVDLESVYQLTNFKLWNHNDPASLDNGMAEMQIHTSLDNTNWSDQGVVTVPVSDGSAFYEGVDVFNFNGSSVRYILLTGISNHGGSCYGLAEMRYYQGQAVPIELASFEGACDEEKKALRWTFADITDFATVSVERSVDGKEWNSLYTTTNPGNEGANRLYESSYEDIENSKNEVLLYRLKMYDIDGDFQYSNIIELACGVIGNDFNVFPNPVGKQLFVNLELAERKDVTYTVKDIVGKTVLAGSFEATQGANQFEVNTSSLVDGSYYISIDLGTETVERKILKMAP